LAVMGRMAMRGRLNL